MQYVQNLLESEKGELTTLDHEVLDSLQRHETLSPSCFSFTGLRQERIYHLLDPRGLPPVSSFF